MIKNTEFNFIERGRRDADQSQLATFSIEKENWPKFRDVFNPFILEIEADDKENNDPDEIFINHGYTLWDEVLSSQKNDYLYSIVKDLLYTGVFYLFLLRYF